MRHVSLKFPATGKMTVKLCPFTIGGVVTHVEPSNVAGSLETPGHPSAKNGRGWPAVRKVTVWISSASNCQVMRSPALIQISLGRNARAWCPLSCVWPPTIAFQWVVCPVWASGEMKTAARSDRQRKTLEERGKPERLLPNI